MQNSTDQTVQWDDIRYFLALAEEGSLSAAARLLNVEHSTVARRVDALEQVLGLRLFDRLPRGWRLTPEGETLSTQALRLEEEALAFGRMASGVSALSGTVRISSPPAFASYFLSPRLVHLRSRWPDISLTLIGEARETNLSRHEADLALRLSRPTAPGLVARAIGQLGFGVYATTDWCERGEHEWEFLGYDESLQLSPQEQWLEKFAQGRPFALRANELATLFQGARAGLGLAVLPHFLGADDDRLVLMPGITCPVRRDLWLVLHPDVRRSPKVRVVADALVEIVQQHCEVLTGLPSSDTSQAAVPPS